MLRTREGRRSSIVDIRKGPDAYPQHRRESDIGTSPPRDCLGHCNEKGTGGAGVLGAVSAGGEETRSMRRPHAASVQATDRFACSINAD